MYKSDYPIDEGWPSDRQELFLKIAMLDPDAAYEIWQGNRQGLSSIGENVSSRFILPLVYQNLMGFYSALLRQGCN